MPRGSIGDDSGANTNPERWLQDNHWNCDEVELVAAATALALGAAVAVGATRRIREITIRNVGSNNTVVTITDGTDIKLSIDVPAQTTRVWSSQDGRLFAAGETPDAQTSDITGGSTYVSAGGVEA